MAQENPKEYAEKSWKKILKQSPETFPNPWPKNFSKDLPKMLPNMELWKKIEKKSMVLKKISVKFVKKLWKEFPKSFLKELLKTWNLLGNSSDNLFWEIPRRVIWRFLQQCLKKFLSKYFFFGNLWMKIRQEVSY